MRVFLLQLVLCTTFVIYGRPEAGYRYNTPGDGGVFFSETLGIGGTNNDGFSNEFSQSQTLSSGSGDSSSYFGDILQQVEKSSIIQKHIYVHVPPPEQEEFHQQRPISTGVPQKHYKIIFIKAPSSPQPTPPQIPLPAQNQEKTIVYVLVKKPEEIEDIVIPTVKPTQPSKPEVYFIKYKTQSEQGQYQQPQQQYSPPDVDAASAITSDGDVGTFAGAAGFGAKILGSLVG